MKTLDEVLKAFELSCGVKDCGQCPYDDECLDHHVCECYERMNDALHYLKEYRTEQKILSDSKEHYEYWGQKYYAELEKNDPLSWQDLKQMEGKPVWVEHLKDGAAYKAGWCLVVQVDDSLPDMPCIGLADTNADYCNLEVEWMVMGQWQAYRKERS